MTAGTRNPRAIVRRAPTRRPSQRTASGRIATAGWTGVRLFFGRLSARRSRARPRLRPELSNRAPELCMVEQWLDGTQVLRASIDQRRYRSPHCMRAVRAGIESNRGHPRVDDLRVLSSGNVVTCAANSETETDGR